MLSVRLLPRLRMLAALLLACAAIVCFVSCDDDGRGRGSDGDDEARDPLVFSVGGAPAEIAVWETFIADFEEASGVDVEIARQPADTSQRRQGLIVALDSGQSNPDVFLMDVAWIGLFAAADWLAPLEDVDRAPFFSRIVELVDVYEGELIALPVYVDGGLLYYRTDLLEKYGIAGPPKTIDELIETALVVQEGERADDPDFHGFVWQGAQYEGLICVFLELAGQGGGLVREDGRLVVDHEANLRALRAMTDMIWEHDISPVSTFTEMREEEVRTWFQSGDALYERNWPYAWPLHQSEESPVRGKVGVAPVPAIVAEERTSTLGGWHVGVSIHCDRKADAQRLVEFITSYETQKRMAIELGWNPGRRDLYEDPDVLEHAPHLDELKEVFERAKPRPVEPYYTQLSRILQRRFNAALAGDIAPERALEEAQTEIDRLLERYAPEESAMSDDAEGAG